MGNYKGIFFGLDGRKYEVRLKNGTGDYQDITMAGSEPFVVTYETSDTPFEPIRTSTCTVQIVSDNYMEDILGIHSQDTAIELVEITESDEIVRWCGYLTPKIYDMAYEKCYETIQLEGADCLSNLQYTKYEEMNGRGIVSIKSILDKACDSCGELTGYWWGRTKKVDGSVMLPSQLYIPEQNFYYNDTDDSWDLQEVVEEICRFFGFTCLQYGTHLYFVDYQALKDNETINYTFYGKNTVYIEGASSDKGLAWTLDKEKIRKNGATISFEPVYNKVTVVANMNNCEEFIPSMMSDDYLTNRNGDFYSSFEVTTLTPDRAKYAYNSFSKNRSEDVADSDYTYFHRLYDNKYWESLYYNTEGTQVYPVDDDLRSYKITRYYGGGTIVDEAEVRNDYQDDTKASQKIVASKVDYNRYLLLSQKHRNTKVMRDKVLFRLKEGYKMKCGISENASLVLSCTVNFQRHDERDYINPDWKSEQGTKPNEQGGISCTMPKPKFRLNIGNKGWNGTAQEWVEAGSAFDYFEPKPKWDDSLPGYWNTDAEILNTVSWKLFVNEDGYRIPLEGVDMESEIKFEIINPDAGLKGTKKNGDVKLWDSNAYCWISDFSLKVVEPSQGIERTDSDITYENVIDGDAVQELSDITVKLTSFPLMAEPSYSNVLYKADSGSTMKFLTAVSEASISGTAQRPEENIVEKYVQQYDSQTKKITTSVGLDITPLDKVYAVDVDSTDKGYVQLGSTIDYENGRQEITFVQKMK